MDTEKRFIQTYPQIKLSYETLVHKKVLNADIILAIPQGKKCYVWFTTEDTNYVCYLLELGNGGNIDKTHKLPCSFSKELSYGSVFYGTMYLNNHRQFVIIEDVFFYKGKSVFRNRFSERLDILYDTFVNNLKQITSLRKAPIFGLPTMHTNHEELIKLIPPQQRIGYFQYKHFNKHNAFRVKPHVILKPQDNENEQSSRTEHKPPTPKHTITKQPLLENRGKNVRVIERVFSVSADLQNDIYLLTDKENKHIGIAYIPSYEISVMMNKLFRNIKENDNLDTLEESDSEEEFEDERIDKYVDLDKKILMVCKFHNKFKKWVPTKVYDRCTR